jgi:hypothetical protein
MTWTCTRERDSPARDQQFAEELAAFRQAAGTLLPDDREIIELQPAAVHRRRRLKGDRLPRCFPDLHSLTSQQKKGISPFR